MIPISKHFDLGLDRTRIKDRRDAERQTATVRALLDRLYTTDDDKRWELQIVADEVGMGKTFVALGVAYSVLHHRQRGEMPPDLASCMQKVLILVPGNASLFEKWRREVEEFVRRCVHPEHQVEAQALFKPEPVEQLDELARALSRGGRGAKVIVAHPGVLSGKRIVNYELKRRYLLGCLFRYWGASFRGDRRERLLRGAPAGWPRPGELLFITEREHELLTYTEDDAVRWLALLDREGTQDHCGEIEELRQRCIELSEPYVRERDQHFKDIERRLVRLHERLSLAMVKEGLPLVIVDEAHNWKNGPDAGTNGYKIFSELIAPKVRRLLLLTATPFQLRPEEMLQLLRIGEDIQSCRDRRAADARRQRLRERREQVIAPVLKSSAEASKRFARAWGRLPSRVTTDAVSEAWYGDHFVDARARLRRIATAAGQADERRVTSLVEQTVAAVDPDLRQLMREALGLYTFNADLSQELGELVIRHRRRSEHRMFRVGDEYIRSLDGHLERPDRHVLHSAPGLDVRGDGELPLYLLMRCVTDQKQRGRSSLGQDLTGCYSTLLASSEWRKIEAWASDGDHRSPYPAMLKAIVDPRKDPEHPKLKEVVRATLEAWKAGEKTLIFCFRTNTAERLRDIIRAAIERELRVQRTQCLGGETQLRALRSRLTGRDRDLIGLGLDRVLLSMAWASQVSRATTEDQEALSPGDLLLRDDDLVRLAELALAAKVDLLSERVDRVFLNRAIEHTLARRLTRARRGPDRWRKVLEHMAEDAWVERPYACEPERQDGADAQGDATGFDERGVHTVYKLDFQRVQGDAARQLAEDLAARRRRAGIGSIFDQYARGPSLWFGVDPLAELARRGDPHDHASVRTLQALHDHLWEITHDEDGWAQRMLVFQALRRALLRDSVLLRLLPEKTERDESGWGELLTHEFFNPLPGQRESMADRIAIFVEDLRASSGSVLGRGSAEGSSRHRLFEATKLRDQQFVALVTGSTPRDQRERVFAGFNTPLLPEVLVCTSVGQEGIDLHRHCRHVVHYDLAWNPAVLEQRTGRADRIGSKTFRERDHGHSQDGTGPFLEIGVPFLAGTYDERQYEELRLRSQTFEVLTGGDLSAEQPDLRDDRDDPAGKAMGLRLMSLPDDIVRELRVDLAVWRESKTT